MVQLRITFVEDVDLTAEEAESLVRDFAFGQSNLEKPILRTHDTGPIEVDIKVMDASDADELSPLNLFRREFWKKRDDVHNVRDIDY